MELATANMMDLITYDVNEFAIEEMRDKYLSLEVANHDDKVSYELCKKSRAEVRSLRIAIENRRKELKAESLSFGRAVDSKAKELTGPLVEIENHLKRQEAIVTEHEKRLEAERLRALEALVDERIKRMAAVGRVLSRSEATEFNKEGFELALDVQKRIHEEAEAKRKAEQEELEALRKEKAERDAREAKEAAERKAKQDAEDAARRAQERAEREKVEAENNRLLAEKRERERKAEAEKREAARKIRDRELFEKIQRDFPTLESAWVEIARLMQLVSVDA